MNVLTPTEQWPRAYDEDASMLDTEEHYWMGAAVAFGLMGMAWEIYFTYSCCLCTFVTSSRTCERCGFVELDRTSPGASADREGG